MAEEMISEIQLNFSLFIKFEAKKIALARKGKGYHQR